MTSHFHGQNRMHVHQFSPKNAVKVGNEFGDDSWAPIFDTQNKDEYVLKSLS